MMRDLKPCPFCGSTITKYSVRVEEGVVEELNVTCERCHSEIRIAPPIMYGITEGSTIMCVDGDAIDIWNMRKDEG